MAKQKGKTLKEIRAEEGSNLRVLQCGTIKKKEPIEDSSDQPQSVNDIELLRLAHTITSEPPFHNLSLETVFHLLQRFDSWWRS